VHGTGAPLKSRRLASWIEPDKVIADAISAFSGPIPDRIVVLRLFLHDVAMLLPPAWREKAELDCDDWETSARLSFAALALRQGHMRMALQRLKEAVRYALVEREAFRSYKTVYISAFEDMPRIRWLTGSRALKACANQIASEPGLSSTCAFRR